MDDMDDTHEAILSHKCDVRPLCINGRRAVCSELRVVRVRVRDGVLVIHRSVLKHDVGMREGIRNAVAIIVYRKCSWIWGARFIPFTPPVGDSRLPSAVTDFTIKKIPNSYVRWDSSHKSVLNHPKYRSPRVIGGHTIFEVSARN